VTWWWQILIGIGAALILAWAALVVALLAAQPSGLLLTEAMRLLPDLLRLLRRLAADRSMPRGVRVRLVLLLAYTWPSRSTSSRCPDLALGTVPTARISGRRADLGPPRAGP
jgi:hypothetical protein